MIRNIKGKIVATLCALTMVVSSMGVNTYADDTKLEITKQPTKNNLTVKANKDNASYQWYKAEDGQTYAVDPAVGMIVGDTIIGVCDACGDADCETDGVWSGNYIGIRFGVEEGDVVKVTQIGDYEVNPTFPGSVELFEDDGTGVYTCEISTTEVKLLWIYSDNIVSSKVEIVRDGVTYTVVNGCKDVFDGKVIGVQQGDSYYDDAWCSDRNGTLTVDVYLKNGQTIKVTTSDECTSDMIFGALRGGSYSEVSGVDNLYTCMAEESGIYRIEFFNAESFEAEIEVIDVSRGQAIEGQTTNTLTSVEEGAKYSCLVKCGDEEVWSDYANVQMLIVTQPTIEDPTVKMNYPELVQSYQWYFSETVLKKIVLVNAEDMSDDESMVDYIWRGTFEDGKWYSEEGSINIGFYGVAGLKAIVKLPEDFEGVVCDCDTGINYASNNGVYELEIYNENGYMDVYIGSDEDFTAEIIIEVLGEETVLEGENKATLENFEMDEAYVCKVITKKGTELISEYVYMQMAIIKQPTAGSPTVGVNFEDAVAGYQWYDVYAELLTVVEDDAQEGEIEVDYYWGCEYVDGKWESEDGYMGIIVEAKKGDKILITLPEDFEGEVYECYSNKLFSYNEGVYEYTINGYSGYCDFYISSDVDFSADIKILSYTIGDAIENETTKTLKDSEVGNMYVCCVTCESGKILVSDYLEMEVVIASQPTATNPTVGVNFEDLVDSYQWHLYEYKEFEVIDENLVTDENEDSVIGAEAEDGIYEDDAWVSEEYRLYMTAYDFIITFEAEEGDLIKIVPSTEAIFLTMTEDKDGNYGVLECEDGVYYCEVEKSGEFTVGLLALEAFTAKVTVERDTFGEAVSGQTGKTLKNHQEGTYICKVTLEDGTVLLSDMVSIEETDIRHSYTNDEDADCNDCGAKREITSKPGVGGTEVNPSKPGDEDTESNPSNPDNDGDGSNTGTGGSGPVSPNTGNNVNIMLISLLLCVSVVGILGTSVYNKKRYQ